MIGITMYNEEWDELHETLVATVRNFKYWKKKYGAKIAPQIVVNVVIDGRTKMSDSVRKGAFPYLFNLVLGLVCFSAHHAC